ncbi:putativesecreted protein [Patulibacter medicamentivorans]|uniref:Putativesecreted protein n=1 Tax=Patulibacter medicamentivorans TaxID=1097667 RepID=H0E3N7_9ACTN|nr:NlpC/P60 family protein [Patulibacter medicamentivorans]EHN11710.1 putativesecreted protein [Patulibacter medicamentivorans]
MTPLTRGAALAAVLTLGLATPALADQPSGGVGTGTDTAAATTTTSDASSTAAATVSPTKTVKLTRSQTKSVQRRVRVRADGALGARTRSAIKRYQKRKRLTRTGRPNLETLRTMRLAFAAEIEAQLASSGSASADSTSTAAAPAPAGAIAAAIAAARSQIGTPYRSGGSAPGGFDCSGLMVWAFKQAGIALPRTSFDQYEEGVAVDQSAIQPGDLVFFSTAGPGASHVGIATSATTVISATTRGVMEHKLNDSYWGAAYVGARRISG